MKITLTKKSSSSERDPLLIMIDHPDDLNREKANGAKYPKLVGKAYYRKAFEISELIPDVEVDEDSGKTKKAYSFTEEQENALAYAILAKYKGCFVAGDQVKSKAGYKDKSLEAAT